MEVMQRQALTTFTNRSVYAASLQATATSPRHTQFIAQHDVITRHGISLWSVWASLLPTPETEAALTLCTYSAIAKTLMRYQHYFGHQSKTQHHIRAAMKEINSIPSSPSRSASPGGPWSRPKASSEGLGVRAAGRAMLQGTQCRAAWALTCCAWRKTLPDPSSLRN